MLAVDLSNATVLFLGYGRASWPQRDEATLARELGAEKAAALREQIDALCDEMQRIDVDWSTCSLAEAGDDARAAMRLRHPELSDDALDALRWQFTYFWK